MEYLLLIHDNTDQPPTEKEWGDFIEEAIRSGNFQGGSALGATQVFGKQDIPHSTASVGGFMRFNTDKLNELELLLNKHPVVKNGGSIELIEMPRTS